MENVLDSIADLISNVFDTVFSWVVDFVLRVIFFLPTVKAEEQGDFILDHLYGLLESFNIENFISFFVGLVFFIFCFKIALDVISIIRG